MELIISAFALIHIFGFVGALANNYQRYRIIQSDKPAHLIPAQEYVDYARIFAQALFILFIGVIAMFTLLKLNRL